MMEEWLNDARKIPDEVMSFIRKIAVRAIDEYKMSPEIVSQVLGISRTAIYDWLRRYQKGGYPTLDTKKAPGVPRVITPAMDDWLKETVLGRTPLDFGYDTVLWTRDILAALLNKQFGIDVGGTAVSNHLQELKLSYQTPWFHPQEQDPQEVRRFLDEKFPKIQKLADKIGADIGFEDEAGVGLQTHSGKTWGAKGKTPVVPSTGKRGGYNVLSIVMPNGTLRFTIEDGKINSDVYINFLRAVILNRTKPLILLLDRASFHNSKKVRDCVRSHRTKIRVFFLPRYSPEMNPDEQVWNEVKSKKIGRKYIKNKFELKRKLYSVLRSLQRSTEKLKSLFRLPHTKYASILCVDN